MVSGLVFLFSWKSELLLWSQADMSVTDEETVTAPARAQSEDGGGYNRMRKLNLVTQLLFEEHTLHAGFKHELKLHFCDFIV